MTNTLEQARRAPGGLEPDPDEQRRSIVRLVIAIAVGAIAAVNFGVLPAVLVVVAILVMVMLHELGHFATAKWSGMKVTEFFVGFGPRLWSVRKGETEYGIKALPLGGYVKILGMHNLEQVDPTDEPRTYRQQSFPRRLSVAVAGSAMHMIIAFVLIFVLLAGIGVEQVDDWEVGEISRLRTGESPAQDAGLQLGDRVISADGRSAKDFDEFRDYVRSQPGETITLVVERDGERVTLRPTLAEKNPDGENVGFLGAAPKLHRERMSPLPALRETTEGFGRAIWGTGDALAQFFSRDGLEDYGRQLTGSDDPNDGEEGGQNRLLSPVGAVRIASQAADAGVIEVLQLLIAINLFVGLFNMIPLLPFDGGHVAVAVYERVRSRRGRPYHADVAKLMPVAYAVVVVLLTLGITALWLDSVSPADNPFE